MYIHAHCQKCSLSKEHPEPIDFKHYKVPVNEEGIYHIICDKGHETTSISRHEKYEILFQMGAEAFLEGFYFEAVSCFITSVERFREWCIKFFAFINNIPVDKMNKFWNSSVKKSSERQLGAFYFMYLDHFKEIPTLFLDDQMGFRNKVLHNGEIPTHSETYEFGEYCMDYIREIQKFIYTKYEMGIFAFSSEKLKKNNHLFTEEKIKSHGINIHNPMEWILDIDQAVNKTEENNFRDELKTLKKIKEHLLTFE